MSGNTASSLLSPAAAQQHTQPIRRSATEPAQLAEPAAPPLASLPSPRSADDLSLGAPRPGFLYQATANGKPRPASYSSFSSLSSQGGRVQLGGSPQLGDQGGMRLGSSYQVHPHHQLDHEGATHQQEEVLDDDEVGRPNDPYTWERPLDTVHRHSRMLDAAPIPSSPAESSRRLSRIPSAGMLDPFGFSLSAEPSPYDSALAYSNNPQTRQRASFLGPPQSNGQNSLGQTSPYPSTSSMQSMASGSSYPATSTGATSWASGDANGGQGGQPWLKPRSASMGDAGSSSHQIRSSLMARPGNRSKLSGEINADTQSLAEIPMSAGGVVPKEADYSNSKLYQRTLKAQKALEKERAKAAAKGKISKFDLPDKDKSATSKGERRQSSASSFMSDMPLPGRRSRSSLGWFRSSSEATLPIPPGPSFTPPLPTSRSVSQLPLPTPSPHPPSPALDASLQQQQQQAQRLNGTSSNDRLRAYRASVGAAPPPRSVSPGDPRRQRQRSYDGPQQQYAAPPSSAMLPPNPPSGSSSRTNSEGASRPRQSSLVTPSAIPLSPNPSNPSPPPPRESSSGRPRVSPRSTLDVDSSSQLARTPSPLSAAELESQPRPPRTDSIYASSKEPSFDQDHSSRGRPNDRAPSPSPPSSESSPNSPVTPQSQSTTGLGLGVAGGSGPSLPPGAAPSQTYPVYGADQPLRKRKSSLNMLLRPLGGRKEEPEVQREQIVKSMAQRQQQQVVSRPPPIAAPAPTPSYSTTPKKIGRGSFFSRSSAKEPVAPTPRPPPQARPTNSGPTSRSDRAPALSFPTLPRSSNTSESTMASTTSASTILASSTTSSKLGKSKPPSSSGGGGFFSSFGRSRTKSAASPNLSAPSPNPNNSSWTDLTNLGGGGGGRGGKKDKELPMPPAASPVLGKQQQSKPVKTKSRWGGGGGDGYHPAPPAYA